MDTCKSGAELVAALTRASDDRDCEARIIADYIAEGDSERASRHLPAYVAARDACNAALTALQQHIAEQDGARTRAHG